MPRYSKELRDLFHGPPPGGTPFGDVYPFRAPPIPPLEDGRTAALKVLKKYLREVVFYRKGGKDPNSGDDLPAIAFRIPERDIHVEFPDDPDQANLPAIAFLSEEAVDYDAIGLTAHVEEGSEDVHAPGTVLVWLFDHVETFVMECWAETKAQRRAMIAGIEVAMSPLEYMSGVRFKMPDYFGELACFALESKELVDDDQAVRNRRRVKFRVKMSFNVSTLVQANPMVPITQLEVNGSEAPVPAGAGLEAVDDFLEEPLLGEMLLGE